MFGSRANMQYKVHPKWEYVSLSLTVAVSNKEKLSSSHGKIDFSAKQPMCRR